MNITTIIKQILTESKDHQVDFEFEWAEKEKEILDRLKSEKE
jgi:hypothetical protein